LTDLHSFIAEWFIEEDPKGSDHFPIIINLSSKVTTHLETRFASSAQRSRPRLSLGFDGKLLPEIVRRKLETSPVNLEGENPLKDWYNVIILRYKLEPYYMTVEAIKNILQII